MKDWNKGFAMLEVMIIITIFMVLASSLFASAKAVNRRAVKQVTNHEAYYAALAAVKLMAGEVINNEQGTAAAALTGGLSEQQTELSFAAVDGETRIVPVKVSSEQQMGGKFLTLTANATVGEQTENVSMTLQNRTSFVPDYPFGSGIMGNLELESKSKIIAGPDVDIYLQGYEEKTDDSEGIVEIGGNLVADGVKIRLRNAGIGGMIISNDDVSLDECVVGSGVEDTGVRKGGIYTTGLLSLTNCDVYGDIYADEFLANGAENIDGSVNFLEWSQNYNTVWDSEGNAFHTSDLDYRRGGAVKADGIRKISDAAMLKDCVPEKETVFVPETDGLTGDGTMTVIRMEKNGFKSMRELAGSVRHGEDIPVEVVIIMEENSTLVLSGGEWNVYVYGKGRVTVDSDTTIYGGIQAKDIILNDSTLRICRGEPADPSMKTPSSAVGFKSWAPLEYRMNLPVGD